MQLQDGPIHLQLCQALLCPLCVFVDCYDVARGSIEESCNNGSALAVKAAAHRKMSRASRNQSASFGIVGVLCGFLSIFLETSRWALTDQRGCILSWLREQSIVSLGGLTTRCGCKKGLRRWLLYIMGTTLACAETPHLPLFRQRLLTPTQFRH